MKTVAPRVVLKASVRPNSTLLSIFGLLGPYFYLRPDAGHKMVSVVVVVLVLGKALKFLGQFTSFHFKSLDGATRALNATWVLKSAI